MLNYVYDAIDVAVIPDLGCETSGSCFQQSATKRTNSRDWSSVRRVLGSKGGVNTLAAVHATATDSYMRPGQVSASSSQNPATVKLGCGALMALSQGAEYELLSEASRLLRDTSTLLWDMSMPNAAVPDLELNLE